MPTNPVYLKQNALAEPLVNQWYAWSFLVPPATLAMFVANHHLKLMQSFATAPKMHAVALRSAAMLGGPFINHDEARAPEVGALMRRTADERADLLELASAIRELDEIVARSADGHSLAPLYDRVPEPLRGFVELVYDANNNASVRFIEPLLYRSRYYDASAQSVALRLVDDDARPFVCSTPWLGGPNWSRLRVDFADERLDALFRTRDVPRPFDEIADELGLGPDETEPFRRLFTDAPAAPARAAYDDEGVRVRYFGHACLSVESRDVTVLTDPIVAYEVGAGDGRFTYADLPARIDYVLLTHNHQDHVMFETLLQLRHKIGTVVVPRSNGGSLVDPSLKLALRQIGFPRVVDLDELESIEIPGGEITAIPFLGEHGDLDVRTKSAYLVRLGGESMAFMADSNNLDARMYEHIAKDFGPIDTLFLGMECEGAPLSWVYGPLMTRPLTRKMDQERRLNGSDAERAGRIVDRLDPRRVFVYAMGQEPWLTHITSIRYTPDAAPIVESNALVEACRARGLRAERLFGSKDVVLE